MLLQIIYANFSIGEMTCPTRYFEDASSISFVAVDKCLKILGNNLTNKKVFIIGTGKTSRLVLEKLKKQGLSKFLFTNRTFETAQLFADNYKGFAVEFNDFKNYLDDYDIVITATGAGEILINKEDIRGNTSQIFIDLAVPRNISANLEEHASVRLITIDSLQEDLNSTASKRQESKKDAEAIIDSMANDYFNWLENRALRPVIKSITENMQKMHKAEIENSRQCYSEETYKAVDEYAGRLTQKYIRTLIKKLKEINENGNAAHSLKTINDLFEFDSEDNNEIS
jgi:glutamyl-tRNA reductase